VLARGGRVIELSQHMNSFARMPSKPAKIFDLY
jgi:hypothetical protein